MKGKLWVAALLSAVLVATLGLPGLAAAGFTQSDAMVYWKDAYEPDDDAAHAKPIVGMSERTFHSNDDEDWSYVDLVTSETVSVETIFGEASSSSDDYSWGEDYGDFDTEVYIWSKVGGSGEMTIVAGNDDHPHLWGSYSSSLFFEAPWTGRYYIDVHELDTDDRGSYWLFVNKGFGRRVYGSDRYETSVWASRTLWPATHLPESGDPADPDFIVLTSGESYIDSMVGAALACALDGQVLLTRPDDLPGMVADEIERLADAENVWWNGTGAHVLIAGGPNAVSTDVFREAAELRNVSSVYRMAGTNRYETAVKMWETYLEEDTFGDTTAYIVNGSAWPDVLAVAPVAAVPDRPVLLTEKSDVPQVTMDFLIDNGFTDVIVVGGEGVVDDTAYTELVNEFGAGHVRRIAGANRYQTALKVARHGVDDLGMSAESMILVSGENWPDAVSGAPIGHVAEAPILLTGSGSLAGEVKTFMDEYGVPYRSPDYFSYGNDQAAEGPLSYCVGGPGAVPESVFNEWVSYY